MLFDGAYTATGTSALIQAPDRRYLMQLRDDRPDVRLRGDWGLFGGAREPLESPEAGLRRELLEELEFSPRSATWFTELAYHLPPGCEYLFHKTYFHVPVGWEELDQMVLHEGQEMRLFQVDELIRHLNVVPWDIHVVVLHARQDAVAYRAAGCSQR